MTRESDTRPLDSRSVGAPSELLSWPAGLSDATALPFVYWRVMHLIDGRRTLNAVADALGSTEAQVRQVVADVGRWLERVTQREQPMTDALLESVTQTLISVVGPMGRLMMDDALDDLPDDPTLSALLTILQAQLSTQHSQALLRQLRTRGIA